MSEQNFELIMKELEHLHRSIVASQTTMICSISRILAHLEKKEQGEIIRELEKVLLSTKSSLDSPSQTSEND